LKNVPKYRTTWTVTKVHVLAISKTQIVRWKLPASTLT
jgi:hypothetical protein